MCNQAFFWCSVALFLNWSHKILPNWLIPLFFSLDAHCAAVNWILYLSTVGLRVWVQSGCSLSYKLKTSNCVHLISAAVCGYTGSIFMLLSFLEHSLCFQETKNRSQGFSLFATVAQCRYVSVFVGIDSPPLNFCFLNDRHSYFKIVSKTDHVREGGGDICSIYKSPIVSADYRNWQCRRGHLLVMFPTLFSAFR